ncbi:hypothetical protein JX266_005168 [Neoarthrinium moseri]|uniref:uncharacterized protein n=1 Tax=Neoarthrinium moseri TaxID=1658444 RepID=UPI001FDCE669|nr:uncharacterized protein JN550_013000 [Neoarthrinium moseri]KAI1849207.1 hypothetical protein JX266_005168 [Neoarthrinium moseri]KAI1857860.1 hypothetical protein JN550_013000 [Neoarthrinium moseri]
MRIQKRPLRSSIQVVLPSRVRPYTRGSGPALAPLRIALKNDSTAYITAKDVLPTSTRSGGLKLQMHYVVRWTDLPAASVLIPATHILDHVSPRALEDYEYRLLLEAEAAEAGQRNEAESAAAMVAAGAMSITGASGAPQARKRKRGRPNKADQLMREDAARPTKEDVSALLPATRTTGPSLSTPQKSLSTAIHELGVEEDVEDESEDAIFKQLYSQHASPSLCSDNVDAEGSDAEEPAHSPPVELNAHNSTLVLDTKSTVTQRPSSPKSMSTSQFRIEIPLSSHAKTAGPSGFTPAGRSAGRWPSDSPVRVPATITQQRTTRDHLAHSSRKRKRKNSVAPANAPTDESAYEVKRLEDDKIVDVDGKKEHWFRVRWEGNWPPDQNPTWEPMANIPRNLVKKYLKKRGAKADSVHVGLDEVDGGPIIPRRKYSSVAEAFAGEIEDAPHGQSPRNTGDDYAGEERLLVDEHESTPMPFRFSVHGTTSLDFAGAFGMFHGDGNGQDNLDPPL